MTTGQLMHGDASSKPATQNLSYSGHTYDFKAKGRMNDK